MKLSTILVPHDGSTLAGQAVPYAAGLAAAVGGRVVLLRVLPDATEIDRPETRASIDAAKADLAAIVKRLTDGGVTAEAHVYDGDAATAILRAARDRNADLLVMSTHGRSGLGRWIYGSVADDVIRHADTPILLVPPHCTHVWPGGRPARILVGLDGSDFSRRILPIALDLARDVGGRVHVARIVEIPPVGLAYADAYPAAMYPELDPTIELDAAREYIDRLTADLTARGIDIETTVVLGSPSGTIASIASEKSMDIIALATHGHGGLTRTVLGSVSTSVLRMSTVPVLLVRPAPIELSEETAPTATTER